MKLFYKIQTLICLFSISAITSVTAQDSITKATPKSTEKPVQYKAWRADNKIDEFVNAKLKDLNIPASEKCSDEVFLRRAYLDVIGTLPKPAEVNRFLYDSRSDKRNLLIEELLDRAEFADYWAMKWCDLLRVKAEFPSNLWPNAVQAYYRWIHDSLKSNKPYDEFARELLTSSGSNFRVAPVNFYRATPSRDPQGLCKATALTFMGVRPSGFTDKQWNEFATFFSQIEYKLTAEWKEEIVFHDPSKKWANPVTEEPIPAVFPDGKVVELKPFEDPRVAMADWLVSSKNPWFAQNIVNRVWFWLMGRGIIHAPDNVCAENPAQNQALLDYLSVELIKNDYDLKHIYRLILNSDTYQRSSIHNDGNVNDETNFSRYYVRRLEAEVFIDAINQITGTTESYSSDVPEPFAWIPKEQRSIKLADGSITSSFLELYGRPPRDTGYEEERNNNPNSAQSLHLLNSTHIQMKLQKVWAQLMSEPMENGKRRWFTSPEIIDRIYVAFLSRYPTEEEQLVAMEYVLSVDQKKRSVAYNDIMWALLNTNEFIYRH